MSSDKGIVIAEGHAISIEFNSCSFKPFDMVFLLFLFLGSEDFDLLQVKIVKEEHSEFS